MVHPFALLAAVASAVRPQAPDEQAQRDLRVEKDVAPGPAEPPRPPSRAATPW